MRRWAARTAGAVGAGRGRGVRRPVARGVALGWALAMAAVWSPVRGAAPDWAAFRPSRDGFAFVNRFEGSPVGGVAGPIVERLIGGRFGLCGGMCLAAADAYAAGVRLPRDERPPAAGSPLFDGLLRRQVESLGAGMSMVPRFAAGMAAPDTGAGSVRLMTWPELAQIAAELRAGRPAAVGLVLTRAGEGALWENHQVLAYGLGRVPALAERRGGRALHLRVYDPNHPGDDACLIEARGRAARVVSAGPGLGAVVVPTPDDLRLELRPGRGRAVAVRGLLKMPWEPAPPIARPAAR